MSTRGIIARPTPDGWEGRYHHFDSYPSGLGAALWSLYHGHFQRDYDAMIKTLIDDHPAGWSTIVDGDFTIPPGFTEHSTSRYDEIGTTLTRDEWEALPQNLRPQCYCHGDRHEPPEMITHKTASPLYHEWAYILRPTGMVILKGARADLNDPDAKVYEPLGDEPPIAYKFIVAAVLDWYGPDPNFSLINLTPAVYHR